MISCGDQVRLTADELAKLRKLAAKHGHVIGEIKTWDDYDEALMLAYPEAVIKLEKELERYFREHPSHPIDRLKRGLVKLLKLVFQ